MTLPLFVFRYSPTPLLSFSLPSPNIFGVYSVLDAGYAKTNNEVRQRNIHILTGVVMRD